jgi:hypothetical protein
LFLRNYTFDKKGIKNAKAITTGSERTRLSIAVCASADGYKLPIVVIVTRVNPLKDFICPYNIIVIYKTKPTFDSKTIKQSFVERVVSSQNSSGGLENMFWLLIGLLVTQHRLFKKA